MRDTNPDFGLKITTPTPAEFETLEVKVGAHSLFSVYAETLLNLAKSRAGQGHYPDNAPSVEEVVSLLNYLLKKRCKLTQGKEGLQGADKLQVPTFFAVGLSQIGVYQDRLSGLTFQPTYAGPADLISSELALEISLRLNWLSEYVQLTDGAVKGSNFGDPDVMQCVIASGVVISRSKEPSVLVPMLAPFFGLELQDGVEPRHYGYVMKYGYVDEARVQIAANPNFY